MNETATEPRPVTINGVPGTLVGFVYVDTDGGRRELRMVVVDSEGERRVVNYYMVSMARSES